MKNLAIKLNLQTSKIEFDFAGETVVANASDENIKKTMELKNSDLKEKAEAESEKLKGIEDEDLTAEDFERMVKISVELYSEIYSPIFEDGAFERVYKHVGSISSTVAAFEEALDYVVDEIGKRNEQHEKSRKQKLDKYKNRKKK